MGHRHPFVFVKRITGNEVLVNAMDLFVKTSQGLVFASEYFREKTVVEFISTDAFVSKRGDQTHEPRFYVWLPIVGRLSSEVNCLCSCELDWERLPDDVLSILHVKG